VEAAFALAGETGKPLFLYWGAEWCPPCHYLKEKIFSHPDFIEKSREFVALYLDGDTERAQIYGEEFGTLGYPTVILFNPGGEEIMRLPSDVGVARYVALMNGALRRMEPISQVMADVMEAGPASAAPGDLNALAFCSWGNIEGLDDEGQKEAAARLYRETPDSLPIEKSRFFTMLLGSELESLDAEEEGVGLTDAERTAYRREVDVLLADPALRNANLFFLFYWAAETTELLHPELSPERDGLMDGWVTAMHQVEADETLSVSDRLSAAFALIALAQLEAGEDEPLPADLVSHVRARVAWAAENASGEREM
jgi:hypothetical protein